MKRKLVIKITLRCGREIRPVEVFPDEASAANAAEDMSGEWLDALVRPPEWLEIPYGDVYWIRVEEVAGFAVCLYEVRDDKP